MNTEASFYGDGGEISCYDLLCGTPRDNEPVFSFLCFSVSKRVVKNISMFIFVLLFYILVLSVVTSNKKTRNDEWATGFSSCIQNISASAFIWNLLSDDK